MAKPRILIIDDEPAILMSAKMYLEGVYDITTETNPDKAMETLAKEKYDTIFLDLTMPGRGGLEVLEELKNKYPEIPVFIVSGWTGIDEKIQNAIKIGASGYISKPFDREKVKDAIEKVLKKE